MCEIYNIYINGEYVGEIVQEGLLDAARSALLNLNERCADVLAVENARTKVYCTYYDVYLDENTRVWYEWKDTRTVQFPYDKEDGLHVYAYHPKSKCDGGTFMDSTGQFRSTCFRSIYTTIYTDDALGWSQPALSFCQKHSHTHETKVGYHE